MNTISITFATFVILLGVPSIVASLAGFSSAQPIRFCAFLAVAALASSMRLSLPARSGTLSVNFLFALVGLVELTQPETTALACITTLIQCLFIPPRKPRWMQILFNVANIGLAVRISYFAFDHWQGLGWSLDMPVRLTLAAIVYYVLNTFPVAAMIALTEKKPMLGVWLECYRWSLPYYIAGALVASGVSVLLKSSGWITLALLAPFVYLIFHYYNDYLARFAAEKKQAQEIANLHQRTIEALALAIEAKDHTSQDHLFRLQTYALAIGEQLGLGRSDLEAIRAASLLHDIGKLAIPEHILSKPGKLTREEMEKVKIHSSVGANILDMVKFPYPVASIVRHHHEKWNGGGYPDGLIGEKIPIGARILTVVDAFDSMSAPPRYRPALTQQEAVNQIVAEAGISYDPSVVSILQSQWVEMEKLFQGRKADLICLSTDLGWKESGQKVSELSPAKPNLDPAGFLGSIAAARQEAQMLFELAQEIGNSLSLDETLSVFGVRVKRAIPYDAIAILVRREGILRPEFVAGENSRIFSQMEIPIGQGVSGWVAEHRKPVLNGNPLAEPGYREDANRSTPMRSALSIPLEGVSGIVGVLSLYCIEKEAFTRDHVRILQAICGKVAISIENALKYRQAESSASTDYLTGLFNARSLFLHLEGELARCRRLQTPLAILVSDLDGFKQVNDRFGHLEGNRLLQKVAQRLKESCREYDCVARMGGDEFVLVLPGLAKEGVRGMIPRLREIVRDAGREVLNEEVIGFSVGEAYFPVDGTDAETLLSEADKRMYHFKAQSKLAKNRGFDFDTKVMPV